MTTLPSAFAAVLGMSVLLSVGIVLLSVGRLWLRRHLGSNAVAALWLLLALRLLFPFSIPLPPPLHASFASPVRVPAITAKQPVTVRVSVADGTGGFPASPTRVQDDRFLLTFSAVARPLLPVGTVLWLGGVLVSLVGLARGAWQVRRWTARTSPVDSTTTPLLWRALLDFPPSLRRGVALRLTDDLAVPTLAGVWRPQIWFPRAWTDRLTPAEISHVLLHELGHARRRDLFAQTLCSLAACLHWFNPLAWLLTSWARAERELACDAWVLAHVGEKPGQRVEPAAYGHTLLKLIRGSWEFPGASAAAGLVAMAVNRHSLSLRFREISAFRPQPRWRAGLALGLAALGLVLGTVRQASEAVTPSPSPIAAAAAEAPSEVALPGSSPAASASPSPSSSVIPGLEFESKFIELSKEAVEQLRSERARGILPPGFVTQLSSLVAAQSSGDSPPLGSTESPAELSPADFHKFVHLLNEQKGVDLLSAPSVTTRENQQATIEIVRDFVYPDQWTHERDETGQPKLSPTRFGKKNTGLTLAVEGRISSAGRAVEAKLSWKVVDFLGFARKDGQPLPENASPNEEQYPKFSTLSMSRTVSLSPDATVVLAVRRPPFVRGGGFGSSPRPSTSPDGSPEQTGRIPVVDRSEEIVGESVVLILVTVHLAEIPNPPPPMPPPPLVYNPMLSSILALPFTSPEAFTSATLTPDAATASPTPDYPYGVPVLGKPGFVTSPYAPDAGYVDLTGYERGQEVRDPYTQKIFLVP